MIVIRDHYLSRELLTRDGIIDRVLRERVLLSERRGHASHARTLTSQIASISSKAGEVAASCLNVEYHRADDHGDAPERAKTALSRLRRELLELAAIAVAMVQELDNPGSS